MKNFSFILFVGCVLFSFPSISVAEESPKKAQIVYINKMVDGKKTWVPDEKNVGGTTEVTAIIVNKLPEPHGFEIPGLVEPLVIEGMSHRVVTFKTDKKQKYQVKCQLHPAHVGTSLTVK